MKGRNYMGIQEAKEGVRVQACSFTTDVRRNYQGPMRATSVPFIGSILVGPTISQEASLLKGFTNCLHHCTGDQASNTRGYNPYASRCTCTHLHTVNLCLFPWVTLFQMTITGIKSQRDAWYLRVSLSVNQDHKNTV